MIPPILLDKGDPWPGIPTWANVVIFLGTIVVASFLIAGIVWFVIEGFDDLQNWRRERRSARTEFYRVNNHT